MRTLSSLLVRRSLAPRASGILLVAPPRATLCTAAHAQYRATAEDKLLTHISRIAALTHKQGKLEQSWEMYEHLVRARRERHGSRHPLTITAIGDFARLQVSRGELSHAEGLAREAAATSVDLLGALHLDSLRHLGNLASVLQHCPDKHDEAEAVARDALEGYKTSGLEDHADCDSVTIILEGLRKAGAKSTPSANMQVSASSPAAP